jgi:hypothetical protein
MTGSSWLGWRFKNGTPLWFKLIVALLIANAVLHFGLLSSVSKWAQPLPDALHSHRVPFMDGVNYFAPAWLGWYLDAWWIGVGLLVLLIVLLVINRGRLERESH